MTEPSSLEERLATLESAVRSLMATNWTDRASVVDASGKAVSLSALAFGEVLANNNGMVAFDATVNAAATVISPDTTPQVVVYVSGGRLRVDWYAALSCQTGYSGALAGISMTTWARGPYPTAAAAAAGATGPGITNYGSSNYLYTEADTDVPRMLFAQAAVSASAFSYADNLPVGFYLVGCTYMFEYDNVGSTATVLGGAGVNKRYVAATPF